MSKAMKKRPVSAVQNKFSVCDSHKNMYQIKEMKRYEQYDVARLAFAVVLLCFCLLFKHRRIESQNCSNAVRYSVIRTHTLICVHTDTDQH